MARSDDPIDKNKSDTGGLPDRKEPDFSYKSRLMSGDAPSKSKSNDDAQQPSEDLPLSEEMNILHELIKPHLDELQGNTPKPPVEMGQNTKEAEVNDPPAFDPLPDAIRPLTTIKAEKAAVKEQPAPPPLPTEKKPDPIVERTKKTFEVGEGLEIRQLGKQFKKRPVLRDVSLNVHRGEAVGLLGPNGAGKTTCFYIISGLIPADYGEITLDGQEITELPMYRRARLGIGYLPQEASIFRGLTVEQNILAILEVVESNRDIREATLESLLAEFSISHLRRTPSIALSGGERRRLEIARALASQPHFILLDEPLAGIDPIAVRDIRELVGHLKDRGIGVLITDHNVRETLGIVDRAYILHEGRVIMEGAPELIVQNEEVKRVYLGEKFQLEEGTE